MVAVRIPGTSKVVFVSNHIGDFEFDMTDAIDEDSAVRYEDVPVIGPWIDYTGSGGPQSREAMIQGMTNELEGDLVASAHGARFNEVTDRGNTQATHRQRIKLVYIKLDGTD